MQRLESLVGTGEIDPKLLEPARLSPLQMAHDEAGRLGDYLTDEFRRTTETGQCIFLVPAIQQSIKLHTKKGESDVSPRLKFGIEVLPPKHPINRSLGWLGIHLTHHARESVIKHGSPEIYIPNPVIINGRVNPNFTVPLVPIDSEGKY